MNLNYVAIFYFDLYNFKYYIDHIDSHSVRGENQFLFSYEVGAKIN